MKKIMVSPTKPVIPNTGKKKKETANDYQKGSGKVAPKMSQNLLLDHTRHRTTRTKMPGDLLKVLSMRPERALLDGLG